mgnify:CR=1 FL=1
MKLIEEFDDDTAIWKSSSARDDREFYGRMGRIFADAGIRKELGGPITDSPDHVWLLVIEDDSDEVVAFSGCRFNADRSIAWFTETYVFPEHRRRGLFGRLFQLKFDLCAAEGARVVKGLANASSRPMFERHGWRVTSVRGSWTYYEMEVTHDLAV